jgi:hemerythrin-like domain-containing protein
MVREDGVSNMSGFGDLLAQHIRFEERELFEEAQREIPPDELAALTE